MNQGREVVRVLGASKPGAWTGQVLARVIEWQLDHPSGTRTECEKWLKAEQEAGRVCAEENGKRGTVPANGLVAKRVKR